MEEKIENTTEHKFSVQRDETASLEYKNEYKKTVTQHTSTQNLYSLNPMNNVKRTMHLNSRDHWCQYFST